jgi:RNA polymerase sigma factor (sigma-70 family)
LKAQPSQEDAFTHFLEQHKLLIMKVAGIYCPNPEDRKDLMQDIVLQLWRSFDRFDPNQAASSTWVYRIALNVSISSLRKVKSRQKNSAGYLAAQPILHWENPEPDDQLEQLYQLINRLHPLERALILLHLEGCKNPEIADIMGMSTTNVSTKLYRIKEKLKSWLSPQKKHHES